ncbi:hypothetical protein [Burkholderia sp. GS2Y]|uniref:Uncharacterized protein n=1 Tax=Burkholderia theae TaxID=3143496 RepID=A0ABU9WRE6_9BURK
MTLSIRNNVYSLVFTDGSMPMPGVNAEPVFRIHSSLRLAGKIMAILSGMRG